ncbi:MAG: prepilin-type N-terminal cleavage/methylation domain-containing protein [Xanthomonadaceae bacterium]|jgi:general secretion pathway protein J|nr:prepilin-type N-terminal cleavage/methylation domain-containing protein [Xanthomonadaceae bacterium]
MSRRAAGFTLIEVLLAMVLLAAGLALAFTTLRSATAVANRGEIIAQNNERARAVEGFLRRRLSMAQTIGFGLDQATGTVQRFSGTSREMRFVSDLPGYLGPGGPCLHELKVVDEGKRLTLSFHMVQAGEIIQDPGQRPPEVLADGLRSVRFRYRGMDLSGGKPADWEDEWTRADILPTQVAIEVETADGSSWPPLIVTLARGGPRPTGRDARL